MTWRAWSPAVLSLLRIVSGSSLSTAPPSSWATRTCSNCRGWARWGGTGGILELVGGVLLVLGLFSRPVAFLLSGEMAIAYWYSHFPRSPFPAANGGDAAILFCFVFLYIAFAGPGPWSVDRRGRP